MSWKASQSPRFLLVLRCFHDAPGVLNNNISMKDLLVLHPGHQQGSSTMATAVRCWLEIFKLSKLEEIYQAIPDREAEKR
jgi:hypothetical protein